MSKYFYKAVLDKNALESAYPFQYWNAYFADVQLERFIQRFTEDLHWSYNVRWDIEGIHTDEELAPAVVANGKRLGEQEFRIPVIIQRISLETRVEK